MLLAIVAFSLSLLGTFLVRSGVLTSVHAFATDPARGVFILVFLAIVVGGSLALYAARAGAVGGGAGFAPVSRESLLLANNILLVVACASVLLGTLYPLFLDALDLGKMSVGPPYFDLVFPILMAPARVPDGHRPRRELAARGAARSVDAASLGAGGRARDGAPVAVRVRPLVAADRVRPVPRGVDRRGDGDARHPAFPPCAARQLRSQARRQFGRVVRHGRRASRHRRVHRRRHAGEGLRHRAERDAGQRAKRQVGGYDFTFRGVAPVNGPNYAGVAGIVEMRRNGKLLETLRPEKRIYNASGSR